MFRGTDKTGTLTLHSWGAYNSSVRVPDMTSTWYTTNDATWELTGVQLERGSVATPFEHRSYGEVADQCYRYYQKFEPTTQQGADTKTAGGNVATFLVPFLKPMRASASVSVTGNFQYYNGSSWVSATTSGGASDTSAYLQLNVGTNGLASGSPSAWFIRSNSQKIILDSEL